MFAFAIYYLHSKGCRKIYASAQRERESQVKSKKKTFISLFSRCTQNHRYQTAHPVVNSHTKKTARSFFPPPSLSPLFPTQPHTHLILPERHIGPWKPRLPLLPSISYCRSDYPSLPSLPSLPTLFLPRQITAHVFTHLCHSCAK